MRAFDAFDAFDAFEAFDVIRATDAVGAFSAIDVTLAGRPPMKKGRTPPHTRRATGPGSWTLVPTCRHVGG